jgi:hypothetical protein
LFISDGILTPFDMDIYTKMTKFRRIQSIKITKDMEETCPICLEKIKNNSNAFQLFCGHIYCNCGGIQKWLEINNCCPYCKTGL